jgi:hypothetical protein
MLLRIADVEDVRPGTSLCWDELATWGDIERSLKALAIATAEDRLGYTPQIKVMINDGAPVTAVGEYQVLWWEEHWVKGGLWEGYRMPDEEVFIGPFTINVHVEEVV